MTKRLQTEFNDRLVTLGDGRAGLRGGLAVEVLEPKDANPAGAAQSAAVLEFIASTGRLDRCDEVIAVSGWQLETYRRNPVFQNAHQYGDIIFTLGRALITEVRTGPIAGESSPGPYLFQRIEFATGVNPIARIAYGLYQGRFLNAVSVGFIPVRWQNGEAGDGYRRKYLEQELLEVSAVGIPANPDALQLAVKAGAVERRDLRESLDLVRWLAEAERIRPRAENAAEGSGRTQELLRVARELRRVIACS